MGHTNTKKMVQGAMIASLFGVLSILNTYTGSMFDIFICYGMVIPIVWYGYQYNVRDNIIVCIVAMFVIALVGLPFFVISAFSSCLAGVFIGEALRRKAKKETILLGTFLTTLLNNILLYEVFAGILDLNMVDEMTLTYQQLIQWMPSMADKISLDMMLSLIPLVLMLMSLLEMYIIVSICQLTLSRLKIQFPGQFHIALMHLSKRTGFVLMFMLGLSYILNMMQVSSVYVRYLYLISYFTLALQGMAFVTWLLILLKKPLLMILAMIGLIVPVINTVYVVIGIIDIFSDLRGNLLYNNRNDG